MSTLIRRAISDLELYRAYRDRGQEKGEMQWNSCMVFTEYDNKYMKYQADKRIPSFFLFFQSHEEAKCIILIKIGLTKELKKD